MEQLLCALIFLLAISRGPESIAKRYRQPVIAGSSGLGPLALPAHEKFFQKTWKNLEPAFTLSALIVPVKGLLDLKLVQTRIRRIFMAVASVNDVFGRIFFSFVFLLVRSTSRTAAHKPNGETP